jgi:NAD-dependent DNA ligase
MNFNFSKLNKYEKVSYLQRFILVHSYIYYELDKNIISDKQYDESARLLAEMQNEVELNKTDYGYVFDGFTGVTGFDLFSKLTDKDKNKIVDISITVVKKQ